MRFDGEWLQCDDGIVRPVIRAEILAADQQWVEFELLIDTGADRTVISADVLESLNAPTTVTGDSIAGVGGVVDSVSVRTRIRLPRNDGRLATFRGEYAACTQYEALDMSVLGRDILDMFALIVDRRTDIVTMIGGQHHYTISSSKQ